MENYYDIVTPEELEEQFDGLVPDAEELARKRDLCAQKADHNFELLTYLFVGRREFSKARECFHQISDDMLRMDTGRMIAHDLDFLDWSAKNPV